MSNCSINNYGCEALADGLSRNTSLKQLDIANNKFTANGLKRWSEVINKSGLIHLDMSNNALEDEGTLLLIKGIQYTSSTEPVVTSNLTSLGLRGVSMRNAGASALCVMMTSNIKIINLKVETNSFNHKYLEELKAACKRNKQILKSETVPRFKDELGHLIEVTKVHTKQESLSHAS